jgi:hypothetical protein
MMMASLVEQVTPPKCPLVGDGRKKAFISLDSSCILVLSSIKLSKKVDFPAPGADNPIMKLLVADSGPLYIFLNAGELYWTTGV